jgi:precorrin-2 dehydrogenase/sirohydrochlorin ferrochelatase
MMLDVRRRRIVIVGGGAVAVRKAVGLLEAGASEVLCVAPTIDAGMPAGVSRLLAEYDPAHLEGAGLAFAATDSPSVNRQVVRDAHARGLLVCRADADADEPGDFATPAKCQHGEVTITVSAAGNPALAVLIRDELARQLDVRWARMADAMTALRPAILASGMDAARRREALRALATTEALDVLASGGAARLHTWLSERFPELRHA